MSGFSRIAGPVLLTWSVVFATLPPAAAQSQGHAPEIVTQVEASRAKLAAEHYVTPPDVIVKLVTTPRLSATFGQQSPDRRLFLREETDALPGLNDLGKLHHFFAGLQVDPAANRARALTTRGSSRLRIVDATTGASRAITVPAGARVTAAVWSPDGRHIAFIANFPGASHAYVADAATGTARQITPAANPLLATLVTSLDWTAGSSALVAVLVPADRGPEPRRPGLAEGPLVRLWLDSAKSPQRNFASLLQDPFEQRLMEYHTTGQLAVIDVRTRAVRRIGRPATITSVDAAPDGRYFRVTTMRPPYSYVVQYQNFGRVEEIWDASGSVLAEVMKRPLREAPDTSDTPGPGGPTEGSKRSLSWMPDGSGLYYLESVSGRAAAPADSGPARPAGGGGNNRPDRLVRWSPPFGPGDTTVLYRSEGPLSQVVLSEDGRIAFFAATRAGQGELFAVHLAESGQRHPIIRQRNFTPSIAGRTSG